MFFALILFLLDLIPYYSWGIVRYIGGATLGCQVAWGLQSLVGVYQPLERLQLAWALLIVSARSLAIWDLTAGADSVLVIAKWHAKFILDLNYFSLVYHFVNFKDQNFFCWRIQVQKSKREITWDTMMLLFLNLLQYLHDFVQRIHRPFPGNF